MGTSRSIDRPNATIGFDDEELLACGARVEQPWRPWTAYQPSTNKQNTVREGRGGARDSVHFRALTRTPLFYRFHDGAEIGYQQATQHMMSQLTSSHLPKLPACQVCAQRKIKCDNSRPKCSPCARSGSECLVICNEQDNLSRALIDDLEKKEMALSLRLRELTTRPATNPGLASVSSPSETQRLRSIAASSPDAREGANLSFIAHLFADANWRKSHAALLRTLANAPGAAGASIAPCSLPSAAETQVLFEKYLSWSHIQNPFLLRREVWALHSRLFTENEAERKHSNQDLFRAFMICAIGSVLPYRNGLHRNHPEAYYNAALQYLGPDYLTRGLETVQDLLLVCRFGIYHPIGTSIWDVIRLCGRLCIELGLHTNVNDSKDLLRTQHRRRIFWQFYLIDRYSSTTLDRPFLIDDEDIETKLPVETSDEEIEAANSNSQDLDSCHFTQNPTQQNEMTVFFVSLRLRRISSHIQTEFSRLRRKLNNASSRYTLAGHVHVVMTKLFKELANWRSNTPIIQNPTCLYETQEWYDLLHARERLAVLRRAIDLVPKVNGSPSGEIVTVFLRTALETIESYHVLCQKRNMMTHTRSYFHMLFTAGLSVMYCISVSKKIKNEDLRASFEGLSRCEKLLVSIAKQLLDAHDYVAVFEALHLDILQRLRHNGKEPNTGLPSGTLPTMDATGESQRLVENTLPRNVEIGGLGSLSVNTQDNSDFLNTQQFFDQNFQSDSSVLDLMGRFTGAISTDTDMASSYEGGTFATDRINWSLLNHDSLWNMESALGQYVYGDPASYIAWEGSEM